MDDSIDVVASARLEETGLAVFIRESLGETDFTYGTGDRRAHARR
jgi:hypothetical protein